MDKQNIKLSIIIPCFNSSYYIEDCLLSVIPYINRETELIIINDGSTDDTLDKIISLTKEKNTKNIKIITQENAGLSAARNKGIQIASGEYLSFLDSDDFYDVNFWKKIPEIIKDTTIDIVEFNSEQFEHQTTNIVEHLDCDFFSGKVVIDSVDKLMPAFKRCKWYPWARVYKKSLFTANNIEFPHGRLYEDMSTVPLIYLKCRCIYGLNESLIWYRFHKKSITQTFREKDIFDLIYAIKVLSHTAIKTPDIEEVLYPTVHRILSLIKYNLVRNDYKLKVPASALRELRSSLMFFIAHFKIIKKIQAIFLPFYFNTVIRMRKRINILHSTLCWSAV